MNQTPIVSRSIALATVLSVAPLAGAEDADEWSADVGYPPIDMSATGSLAASRSGEPRQNGGAGDRHVSRTGRLLHRVMDLMHPFSRLSITPSVKSAHPGGALQPMIRVTFRF
ncbi:MAG: hypothetical protein U9R74_14160 [Pseudomonadota bacterium]|nr:hypothetical protein [Pseudomonadota bacterium]